jgi:two-component system, OmpR family, response regulator
MGKRILVVDDHPPTRALIRTILESDKLEGFQVVEAASGQGCLDALDRKGPFDLVLLDVTLPDMDGFTVCRHLRTAHPSVPVVFVTARGGIKDYAAGRDVGGDSYLVKPIARSALRSIVSLFAHLERASKGTSTDGAALTEDGATLSAGGAALSADGFATPANPLDTPDLAPVVIPPAAPSVAPPNKA